MDAGADSTAEIAARLRAGDAGGLEDAYRTLGPLVRSYVSRYVPAPDVDDVVQRVFYELWRARDRYDPSRSLRAWVLGIARKRSIDQLRKRSDVVVDIEVMREIAGEDGRDTVERFVWADEVRAALAQLPDSQRQTIELAYFDGMTQTEIADRTGTPLGTVKTRTTRGLARLGSLLEHVREGHDDD